MTSRPPHIVLIGTRVVALVENIAHFGFSVEVLDLAASIENHDADLVITELAALQNNLTLDGVRGSRLAPVLLVDDASRASGIVRLFEAGLDGFCRAPPTDDRLRAAIHRVLLRNRPQAVGAENTDENQGALSARQIELQMRAQLLAAELKEEREGAQTFRREAKHIELSLQADLDEAREHRDRFRHDVEELRRRLAQAERQNADVDDKLAKLRKKVDEASGRADRAEHSLADLEEQNHDLKRQADLLVAVQHTLADQDRLVEALEVQLRQRDSDIRELRESASQASSEAVVEEVPAPIVDDNFVDRTAVDMSDDTLEREVRIETLRTRVAYLEEKLTQHVEVVRATDERHRREAQRWVEAREGIGVDQSQLLDALAQAERERDEMQVKLQDAEIRLRCGSGTFAAAPSLPRAEEPE